MGVLLISLDQILVKTMFEKLIEIWATCPVVPLPTLSHHLLHVVAGVAVFLGLIVYFKLPDLVSAVGTYMLAFVEELISVVFLNETVRNALNDLVQYAFLFVAFFLLRKNWIAAGATAAGLIVLYVLLTLKVL